ncbi:glutamic acid-rich protein-like [Orbicella faveolata]|uniref:glutamic acid-rich protein-like n=1 Tax=Orbicella faveolata TaxID=48498 RepID=UPI0009E3C67F|nr:glutamic acid-rich protein-like [Orbicella faveolata]
MEKLFVTALLFVIFTSSWRIFAVGKENEKRFDFKVEERLAEENDNGFDDRETRLEREGNREFDDANGENSDDDLFFSQDDGEFEKRKSVDYSEWDSSEQHKVNDDTDEAEEEEEEEKEEEEAEKGLFKKLFEKFKNWIRKIGKRKTQD